MGLSQSACLQWVRRLKLAGFIAGYGARIAIGHLADTIYVFTEVTILGHRRKDFEIFEAGIAQFLEAVECHPISGGYDYLLKFVNRGVSDYQKTIERLLDAQIGIEKCFSYIVIKSPIKSCEPDLENLLPNEMT